MLTQWRVTGRRTLHRSRHGTALLSSRPVHYSYATRAGTLALGIWLQRLQSCTYPVKRKLPARHRLFVAKRLPNLYLVVT